MSAAPSRVQLTPGFDLGDFRGLILSPVPSREVDQPSSQQAAEPAKEVMFILKLLDLIVELHHDWCFTVQRLMILIVVNLDQEVGSHRVRHGLGASEGHRPELVSEDV